MSLVDHFIKKNIITSSEAFSLESEVKSSGKSYDEILTNMSVPKDSIVEAKKEYFADFPYYEGSEMRPIPRSILSIIPIETASRYKMIPLNTGNEDEIEVGMLDPENMTANTTLQFISSKIGKPYKIHLISYDYYSYVLKNYRGVVGEVSKALGEYSDIKEKEMQELRNSLGGSYEDAADIIKEDAPIAKIVNNIVKSAADQKASDIHIEINDMEVSVRYRVDGVMKKDLVLPVNIHAAVIARIKIISRIKIDEKRKPQDGRFSGNFLGRRIDFRVSTFPTYYGEKVVMRLLEQDRGALAVSELGLTDENLIKIKKLAKEPYGIILVCGPTGSGKTNTLYSILNELDKDEKNVVSLENPIELNVPGVSQSQVRPEIGYTFGTGLRSILRQDPDIIMVGEIRDEETAKLAIEASLTGHLVLSTIHTNTAADVPQRLVDMGVESYLIGPTLIATVGQRLVRKIKKDRAEEQEMSESITKFIAETTKTLPESIRKKFAGNKIFEPSSIPGDSGMSGRIAVFEILEMTENLKRIIITNPSSIAVYEEARKNGFITFKEDGILKALGGVTTFDEIMKL